MEKLYDFNTKSVKRFTRNMLVIIGFFIVYICSFATLVMFFGRNLDDKVFILICVLASFPLLVFIGFLAFVIVCYTKTNKRNITINEVYEIVEEKLNLLPQINHGEIEDKPEKETL